MFLGTFSSSIFLYLFLAMTINALPALWIVFFYFKDAIQ